MSSVQEIKEAIGQLSSDDRAALAAWFAECDAAKWDRETEADISAGRLDWLREEARACLPEARRADKK